MRHLHLPALAALAVLLAVAAPAWAGEAPPAAVAPTAGGLPAPGSWATQTITPTLPKGYTVPVIDISGDAARQVVVAQGTKETYQGHPTTLLLPDNRTMFAVWTINHGGPCGPMKKSLDAGLTWGDLLSVPENWKLTRNCPAIYRLADPAGKVRLIIFAGMGPDGMMQQAVSEDDGATWSPMRSIGLKCIMPMCTVVPIDGGKRLLGMTNIRRPGDTVEKKSNIVAQSTSDDGGLTWSPWRVVLDAPGLMPCEPALIRSPDGKQLACLMRENSRKANALLMTSDDEGRTWSPARELPAALTGDRHQPRYGPDGRLVIPFRDTARETATKGHFVAWVGTYDDIIKGREGQYRVKLLHSYRGGDCGYPGLEVLPDGTFIATTYIAYRAGENNSVVSTRFKLSEIDAKAKAATPEKAAPAAGK